MTHCVPFPSLLVFFHFSNFEMILQRLGFCFVDCFVLVVENSLGAKLLILRGCLFLALYSEVIPIGTAICGTLSVRICELLCFFVILKDLWVLDLRLRFPVI